MRGVLLLLAVPLFGHDVVTTKVTWTKEVSRLVDRRCATCHNGKTSFPLLDYAAARPWAKAIKEETGNRRMPPWQAVKGFGEFRDDAGLTQEEIELLSDWVEGGAPEGDPQWLLERKPATRKAAPRFGHRWRAETGGKVAAIRPDGFRPGASAQVVAELPDGGIVPLLWIYRFDPNSTRTYQYRVPVDLPAGTAIRVSPAEAGSVTLFRR